MTTFLSQPEPKSKGGKPVRSPLETGPQWGLAPG